MQAGEERPGALAEERRLFYVGLTRARSRLDLTWAGKPSRFLDEIDVEAGRPPRQARAEEASDPLLALKTWRRERAKADGVPAYVVFHDRTLEEIAGSAGDDRGARGRLGHRAGEARALRRRAARGGGALAAPDDRRTCK